MIRFAELFCRTAVQLSCAGVPPSHSGLLPAGFSLGAGEWVTCLYPSGSTWRPFRTGKLSQACPSLWVLERWDLTQRVHSQITGNTVDCHRVGRCFGMVGRGEACGSTGTRGTCVPAPCHGRAGSCSLQPRPVTV